MSDLGCSKKTESIGTKGLPVKLAPYGGVSGRPSVPKLKVACDIELILIIS